MSYSYGSSQSSRSVNISPRSLLKVSFASSPIPGSVSAPQTPCSKSVEKGCRTPPASVPRRSKKKANFAGCQLFESPAPQSIPLPPGTWVANFDDQDQYSTSGCESDTGSISSESFSSVLSSSPAPADDRASDSSTGFPVAGIRLSPHQLIAAITVASS